MKIRDRVRELRRVRAGELRPHPKNWRVHPKRQQEALCGVLAEVGYADALLARELPDGTLQLIDGHLRAQTTPETEVPVLIVDLDDRETAKMLAVLDPLGGLAEMDRDVLGELLDQVETENEAVRGLLDGMLGQPGPAEEAVGDAGPPPEVDVPEAFQVVVDCPDERQQRDVYERLSGEGLTCRLLTL